MPRNDQVTAVLDIEPMTLRPPATAVPDEPFTILVLGGFSGTASKNGSAPVEIDRDNFDEVVARFAPELNLTIAGRSVHLQFQELDDFHPDTLHRRVALFRDIEEMETAPPPRAQAAASEGRAGLLDRIIAEIPGAETGRSRRPASAEDANDLRGFIDRALAPHLVQGESSEQVASRERVHAAATALMRAILHAPELQRLEAAWRGAYFLVRRIETGPNLKIFIADRGASEHVPAPPRDLRWSVIVLDRSFNRSGASIAALSELGIQAMAQNAAVLCEAEVPGGDADSQAEALGGDASKAEAPGGGVSEDARWMQFRRRPEAAHIGLALPRIIARMPYGESGETTDEFQFEEFESTPQHSEYLWMNPAFGLASLLAEAFARDGWHMVPGSIRDLDRLPLHVYRQDDESVAKPCAELLLRESDVEQLLDQGIMPLASIRNTDRVKLVRLQSIADPVCPLAGPWD